MTHNTLLKYTNKQGQVLYFTSLFFANLYLNRIKQTDSYFRKEDIKVKWDNEERSYLHLTSDVFLMPLCKGVYTI
jgi:hypothetical protein